MPDLGRYEKVPRPESIETLQRYLRSNQIVTETELIGLQLLVVRRDEKPNLKVFLTDIYIVGEAEVYEIRAMYPDLDAIVTMSAWNSYTNRAKELCKTQGIGLFTFKEFLGAIYFVDQRFLEYKTPSDKERPAGDRHRWH